MLEDREDIFFRGGQRRFQRRAAKLKLRVALVKVPGDAGAQRHRALEAFVRRLRSSHGFRIADRIRNMRIEHEQHAAIVFACEFAHHQRAERADAFQCT